METFFKPVHSPPAQEVMKPQSHHHHPHHHHHDHQHHPHHHHHHHQDTESHSYTKYDGNDRNTEESHQHRPHHHDDPHHNHHRHHRHHPPQPHHCEEDEILDNHHTSVTLSRASSSSLSSTSSSSSSSSSWYTEASANYPLSIPHAERPQYSLSCSNIPDVHGGFREDDGSKPIVVATVKRGNLGGVYGQINGRSQQKEKPGFSLQRGHSLSDEGPLQTIDSELGGGQRTAPKKDYAPLYKTASMNQSLTFSEESILLGVSGGPKRAMSSSQLPGKGILKNRAPDADIRKAKSMEVLSPRAKGQSQSGDKGKGITQAEIERARENFVQGKLQFSAFLDEITKQVMSPSQLNILGVNKLKTTGKTSTPATPQLPPKKPKEREQSPNRHGTQEKPTCSNPQKHSDHSNPDKLISYAARSHHGSPPPYHYPHTHCGGSRKDRRHSQIKDPMVRDRYGRCGPHLTDGTSTSPEPLQPKHRHHRKQRPGTSHSPPPHPQHLPQCQPDQGHTGPGHRGPVNSPPSPALASGPGPGTESPSSKSDSCRTRDTASSRSSEQSGRHHSRAAHMEHPKQHRDTPCDADQLQALQEENADLHQNLLQTVVCIESLEAELQRTREELSHVKEKYKSLLEMHSGARQANNLLGEHLHTASESLSSERKYLTGRLAHLTSELEDAHRTIAVLENINVPCLIKQLLEKHFDSAEAIQVFLKTASPFSHSATSVPQVDDQSHAPKVEDVPHDWLKELEAGLPRVTAFMPWKQEAPTAGSEDLLSDQQKTQQESNPPFSVADISTAIYERLAASYAASPRLLHPQAQRDPSPSANHTDPPKRHQACMVVDGQGGMGGVMSSDLEQADGEVTSLSAQQTLDDFMHQLHPHKEAVGGKEQQGGQERVGGAGEQTGRVAE